MRREVPEGGKLLQSTNGTQVLHVVVKATELAEANMRAS